MRADHGFPIHRSLPFSASVFGSGGETPKRSEPRAKRREGRQTVNRSPDSGLLSEEVFTGKVVFFDPEPRRRGRPDVGEAFADAEGA
jgi:hypothetical protein